MKEIYTYLLLFIFALGLNSCITEYTPTDVEEVSDLLVVSGTITDGESVFKLSRSVGLSDNLYDATLINNADLYVEVDDGAHLNGYSKGGGLYAVSTGVLDKNKKYRLCASIDGETYQSDFLSPIFTPEIDSLSPMKSGEGQPVYIAVTTHDPEEQSQYFRWTYKENWEVKTELFAQAGTIDGVFRMFSSAVNTYYCWGKDSSKIVLLGSSDKLTENIIYQRKLVEIPCDNDKLSILYHIAVNQIQVRKEAYDYFYNLQKNVEQTGSIFAPVPSEMKGNIRSTSNEELPVIGYIEVATTTKRELYIWVNEGFYEPTTFHCYSQVTEDPEKGLPIYEYAPPNISYAPTRCVDCRIKEKASKIKPDFWPTDHL